MDELIESFATSERHGGVAELQRSTLRSNGDGTRRIQRLFEKCCGNLHAHARRKLRYHELTEDVPVCFD